MSAATGTTITTSRHSDATANESLLKLQRIVGYTSDCTIRWQLIFHVSDRSLPECVLAQQ